MENNDWGGVDQAKNELREDINNLNNMIYNTNDNEAPLKENNEDYRRERIRVENDNIREKARINYNMRQQKRQRDQQIQNNISINDLKYRFNTNQYISNKSRRLQILNSLQEFIRNKKQAIIAGTIAGILAITTIAYGEFQRHSFEQHTESDNPDYIVPTKDEFDAGLTQEQLAAKHEQTKAEEETIAKIINHEEVTPEQIASITTQENIETNSMIK